MLRHSIYKTKTWQLVRKAVILKQGGICARCNRPAYYVHHKEHLTDLNYTNNDIAYNEDNLEALCKVCHNEEHNPSNSTREDISFDVNGNIVHKVDKIT